MKDQLHTILGRLIAARLPIFLLATALIWGYVGWQAYSATTVEADASKLSEATKSAPHIAPETITKIKQLQDNSVEAQTLFDQARQNPFQE